MCGAARGQETIAAAPTKQERFQLSSTPAAGGNAPPGTTAVQARRGQTQGCPSPPRGREGSVPRETGAAVRPDSLPGRWNSPHATMRSFVTITVSFKRVFKCFVYLINFPQLLNCKYSQSIRTLIRSGSSWRRQQPSRTLAARALLSSPPRARRGGTRLPRQPDASVCLRLAPKAASDLSCHSTAAPDNTCYDFFNKNDTGFKEHKRNNNSEFRLYLKNRRPHS